MWPQAGPPERLDAHAGPADLRLGRDEMPGQQQRERLGLADAVLLGERADGVLYWVGRQAAPVVAGPVRGLEIAGQRDADVEVDQLMCPAVAHHTDQPRLRLAVAV